MPTRHDTGAFHLPATIEPVPGLAEEVRRLQEADRPGAALGIVLGVLRDDPRSADAFRWALALCAGRTARSASAAQPVTPEQMRDPLLAPIRTACTNCGASWFSTHELLAGDGPETVTLNPIGLQCQDCRYTLCRNCLPADRGCPQTGCGGELGTPVLATGPAAAPPIGRLEYAVVLGEHAAPAADDLLGILTEAAPGADLTGVGIWPVEPPPHGVDDEFGLFLVLRLEEEGRVGPGPLERTRMVGVDRPGAGHVRVYLVEQAVADEQAVAQGVEQPRRRWWRR